MKVLENHPFLSPFGTQFIYEQFQLVEFFRCVNLVRARSDWIRLSAVLQDLLLSPNSHDNRRRARNVLHLVRVDRVCILAVRERYTAFLPLI